jgi:MFS family permease
MGVAGSFFGSAIGILVMMWTYNNYHQVFWIATIPAVIALTILVLKIKDPKELTVVNGEKQKRRHIKMSDLPMLGRGYWLLMITVALFMSARVGESMLILHANETFGLESQFAPFIVMLYNTTYSLSSYPMGKLADSKNRSILLAAGILFLMLADFLLMSASNIWTVFLGVIFWGLQMGAVQAVFMAMVSHMAPKELRGTAFGIFYLVSAITSLGAGITAGYIADTIDISAAFYYSFIVAGLAMLSVFLLNPGKNRTPTVTISSANNPK